MEMPRSPELPFTERTHTIGDTAHTYDSAGTSLNDADLLGDMCAFGA